MPDPREHTKDGNAMESILRKIPGFKGYLEKEYRRDSDALQREWITDRLQQAKRAIDAKTRELADAAQIDALPVFDRLRGKVDKLIGRIQSASRGYSGLFDLVRIDEAVLDRVYEFDADLLEECDQFANQLEKVGESEWPPAAAAQDLIGKTDKIEQLLDDREKILKGLD